jgi:hypothetical protein
VKPTLCTHRSAPKDLRTSTCFEHYLLILRRRYINGTWYIACVLRQLDATRIGVERNCTSIVILKKLNERWITLVSLYWLALKKFEIIEIKTQCCTVIGTELLKINTVIEFSSADATIENGFCILLLVKREHLRNIGYEIHFQRLIAQTKAYKHTVALEVPKHRYTLYLTYNFEIHRVMQKSLSATVLLLNFGCQSDFCFIHYTGVWNLI